MMWEIRNQYGHWRYMGVQGKAGQKIAPFSAGEKASTAGRIVPR